MLNILRKWGSIKAIPTLGRQVPIYTFGKTHHDHDHHGHEHHGEHDHHDHHEIDR